MKEQHGHRYEFGEFQIDPAERVLFHHGEHVRLQPKTFETLLALVEHSGHVVRKEELMERVWPDAFVEEINLTKNISTLRKTLSNGHGAGKFIETIPTVGYRFVAEVRAVEQGDTEMRGRGDAEREGRETALPEDEERPTIAPLPRPLWLWGVVMTALLGCIVAVGYFRRMPSPPPTSASIAVLPFTNLTGDVEQDYFTDGLAEDLTNDLSRLKDLKVIARNSAFTFKGQDVNVREVGHKLNVATILEGTVQRAGDRWQITTTLRESQSGRVLFRSEHQSNAEENILAIQKEIRCNVAANLQVVLCGGSADIPKTKNLEAYLAYLKGLYQFNLRTPASLQQAIQHLEQAVKLDPDYALAWATLADAYFVGKWYIPLSNEVIPKIKAAAQQAIALDDAMAYAHFVMAVYWSSQGNILEEAQEGAKVRTIDPNYPRFVHSQGITQALQGKYDEGVRLMRQVQQLDPLSLVVNTDVGYVYYLARRYDEAIASYRSALTMDAKFSLAHLLLGLALSQKGQHAEAIASVQQARDRGSEYLAALGNVYARAGQRVEALAILEKLQELARRQYVPPYQFAWIYCGLGDRDQAVASLQKSAQEKAGVIDFKHHPVYEPLRGDARYEELLRQAPYNW